MKQIAVMAMYIVLTARIMLKTSMLIWRYLCIPTRNDYG
jgi:hypothetical protein